ncbi:hypothetical protein [Chryseobacterium sp. JUb7]|uniref:hypothetical protein n=1 Tax=Chryseobacterium sp. JUb7 TaxID=2940599 RepID=UPI00216935CE|nr:hypothetical protein [Chryseobacterium sp. JUb7]MCS3532230.1 hypothetical protein [Chryseobacterium sp. JUb7]
MKNNLYKKLLTEFLCGFIGLLGTTVNTRIGLSLYLLIVGGAFLFAPMGGDENKPFIFYILGSVLILVSSLLLFFKIKQLQKENKHNKTPSY